MVSVQETSIPSGLDEAAKQFQGRWDNDQSPEASFKAGAQWRDAQIPKLPDSIDEAAQKVEDYYDVGEGHGCLCCHRGDIKGAFKAGAEWMAAQGHTVDGTFHHSCGYPSVIELKTYLRDYEGANVIVQIRKK